MIRLNSQMFTCFFPPIAIGRDFAYDLKTNRFLYLKDIYPFPDRAYFHFSLNSSYNDTYTLDSAYVSGYHLSFKAQTYHGLVDFDGKGILYYGDGSFKYYDLENNVIKDPPILKRFSGFSVTEYHGLRAILPNLFVYWSNGDFYIIDINKNVASNASSFYSSSRAFIFPNPFFKVINNVLYLLVGGVYLDIYYRGSTRYRLFLCRIHYDLSSSKITYSTCTDLRYLYMNYGSITRIASPYIAFTPGSDNSEAVIWFKFDETHLGVMEYDFESNSLSSISTITITDIRKNLLLPSMAAATSSYYKDFILPSVNFFNVKDNVYLVTQSVPYNHLSSFNRMTYIGLVNIDTTVKKVNVLKSFNTKNSKLFNQSYVEGVCKIDNTNYLLSLRNKDNKYINYLALLTVNPDSMSINVTVLKEYSRIWPQVIASHKDEKTGKSYLMARIGGWYGPVEVYASGMAENVVVRIAQRNSLVFPYETSMTIEAFDVFKGSSYAEIVVKLLTNNVEFADGSSVKVVKVYPHQPVVLPIKVKSSGKIKVSTKILNTF